MTKRKPEAAEPTLKTFRTLLTFRLHLLANRSAKLSEQIYRERFDLNLLEARVVGITGGYGSISFKRVCQEIDLEKSYASRIINRLVERGYIEKIGDPNDQRSILLELTDAGRKLHDELHAAAGAINEQMLKVLSPEQIRTLMTSLMLLYDRVIELEGTGVDVANPPARPKTLPDAESEPSEVLMDAALAKQLHQMLGRVLSRAGS